GAPPPPPPRAGGAPPKPPPRRGAGARGGAGAAVDLGVEWEEFVVANARQWSANLAASIDELAAASGRPIDASTLEPATLASYDYGRRVTGVEFVAALAVRNRVARALARSFAAYDVLLTPTMPGLPVPLGTHAEGVRDLDGLGWLRRLFDLGPFTPICNVAGTPAMSVPLTVDPPTGLPIGMHFAAAHGREDLLFRLAGQLETAAPWHDRRPGVWAGDVAG
ncbi:amidase family protein, partial [Streptomyces sp. HSW2009]|uniref:amidase family protein n=1 Tax=Streptomyces sp. HSW2009 TaxID=3142890 RepID=UPI0032F084DB